MQILRVERTIDADERGSPVRELAVDLRDRHRFSLVSLTIDPLSAGWDSPIEPLHFRSGCGPLEALVTAQELLRSDVDLVLIEGVERLRTATAADRARRMQIFGKAVTIPEAYTRLTYRFLEKENISPAAFKQFAAVLVANFERTAQRLGINTEASVSRTEMVTSLFRAVDCANPVVDFSGRVLLAANRVLSRLDARIPSGVEVRSVVVEEAAGDGPAFVEEIAPYHHLRKAFQAACRAADVDFVTRFQHGGALLEVYSCFPIVPLAFLLKCGFAGSLPDVERLLESREISVTGGMNFGKAPWNAPVLNSMILMVEQMRARGFGWGGLHGNGGLGGKQGFAVLGRRSTQCEPRWKVLRVGENERGPQATPDGPCRCRGVTVAV